MCRHVASPQEFPRELSAAARRWMQIFDHFGKTVLVNNATNAIADTEARSRISVVIVTYNTREMTLQCLRDLYADFAQANGEVIVVDNASNDGTADAIRNQFPSVRLLTN